MKYKITLSLLLVFLLSKLFVADTHASEGVFNIHSTQGQSMRCYASSILMLDRNYNVLVSCRDIVYPAQGEVFSYVVWANALEETKPIRLGTLGLGRALFKTKKKFGSLFVTTEASKNPRTPSANIVMRGNLESIPLLERPTTPTPTTEEQTTKTPEGQEGVEDGSSRNKVVSGLRRAGLIIFVVLIVVVGIVFIVTRTRR